MRSNFAIKSFGFFAFLLLSLLMPQSHAQSLHDQLKTISTNLKGFTVPFNIKNESGEYIEVQLYVSDNRGASWKFHSRQNVEASGFQFSCKNDGEYWFALKTLDRNGRLIPEGNVVKPEISIIVDSKKPELDFFIESDSAGRIISSWKITDTFVDVGSMILRYRGIVDNGKLENWNVVNLASSNQAATSQKLQDRIAWWPKSESSRIEVEMQISDMAGNSNSVSRTISIPALAAKSRNSTSSTNSKPPQSWTRRQVSHQNKPNNVVCENGVCRVVDDQSQASNHQHNFLPRNAAKPVHAFQQVGSAIEYMAPPVPDGIQPFSQKGFVSVKKSKAVESTQDKSVAKSLKNESISWESKSTKWTGQTQSQDSSTLISNDFPRKSYEKNELGINTQRFKDVPVVKRQSNPESASNNMVRQEGELIVSESTTFGDATNPKSFSAPENYTQSPNPSFDENGASTRRTNPISFSKASHQNSKVSNNVETISVNSKRFNLNYGIKAIDNSGVGKVILWATEDGGNSWQSWSTDPDNVSPFPVEVENEGTYGFKVTINSKDGLIGKAPSSGDQPDVWVRIDLQTPQVAITSAPYGTGNDIGKLVIHWNATDSYLTDQPIDLYYSTNPSGPWTTVAKRLRNSGSYAWKVPKQVPEDIFLRIDARDQAGNVGVFQLTAPLSISGLVPRGKIFSVEPVR